MKSMIVIAISIVAALAIVYLGISSCMVIREVPIRRTPVEGSPADVGLRYEDVEFCSRDDNVLLKGWFIPAQGDHVIIIVNGGSQNRVDRSIGTSELSRDLHNKGYSILSFDHRGRGDSEGKGLMLTHDSKDIGGAVDYIRLRGYKELTVLAFSAGAASTLVFASQERLTSMTSIISMISDSSFSNVGDMLVKKGVGMGFPEPVVKFFAPGFFLVAKLIYGCDRVNPVDVVADANCPVFFIHGGADENIPVKCAHELHEAKNSPGDELWIVHGAGHTQSYKTDPAEYVKRVVEFLR